MRWKKHPCTYAKAAPAVADVGWWDECEEKFPRESDDVQDVIRASRHTIITILFVIVTAAHRQGV